LMNTLAHKVANSPMASIDQRRTVLTGWSTGP
jgi:hypothetical protein